MPPRARQKGLVNDCRKVLLTRLAVRRGQGAGLESYVMSSARLLAGVLTAAKAEEVANHEAPGWFTDDVAQKFFEAQDPLVLERASGRVRENKPLFNSTSDGACDSWFVFQLCVIRVSDSPEANSRNQCLRKYLYAKWKFLSDADRALWFLAACAAQGRRRLEQATGRFTAAPLNVDELPVATVADCASTPLSKRGLANANCR